MVHPTPRARLPQVAWCPTTSLQRVDLPRFADQNATVASTLVGRSLPDAASIAPARRRRVPSTTTSASAGVDPDPSNGAESPSPVALLIASLHVHSRRNARRRASSSSAAIAARSRAVRNLRARPSCASVRSTPSMSTPTRQPGRSRCAISAMPRVCVTLKSSVPDVRQHRPPARAAPDRDRGWARHRAAAPASRAAPRARRRSAAAARRCRSGSARSTLLGRKRRPQRGHLVVGARERAPPEREVALGRGKRRRIGLVAPAR